MEVLIFVIQWLKESIVTLILTFIFCVFLIRSKYKNQIIKMLGLYMVLSVWMALLYCIQIDGFYAFYYALPLHVCSIVIVLAGISVFFSSQLLLECIYYFGIIGAFLALSFPIYVHQRSGYLFYDYFIGHALMLVVIVYHLSNGFRARKYSQLKCYLIFLIAGFVIFILNTIFGTNYWYINEDPGFTTGVISSVWPIYLFDWFLIGFGLMYLLYLPFRKRH